MYKYTFLCRFSSYYSCSFNVLAFNYYYTAVSLVEWNICCLHIKTLSFFPLHFEWVLWYPLSLCTSVLHVLLDGDVNVSCNSLRHSHRHPIGSSTGGGNNAPNQGEQKFFQPFRVSLSWLVSLIVNHCYWHDMYDNNFSITQYSLRSRKQVWLRKERNSFEMNWRSEIHRTNTGIGIKPSFIFPSLY